MTENELLTLHECMLSEIKKLGGSIDKVYYSKGIDDTDKTRKPNIWGIERSGFFNGREKWAKGFENQRV